MLLNHQCFAAVCVNQDLGCLFEIYLKPLEKETLFSRGEVSASHLTALLFFFHWHLTHQADLCWVSVESHHIITLRRWINEWLNKWMNKWIYKCPCLSLSVFSWLLWQSSVLYGISDPLNPSNCFLPSLAIFSSCLRWSLCLAACQRCWTSRGCFCRRWKRKQARLQISWHPRQQSSSR